jgi:Flp pilus assembly secretin CpaC
MRQLGLQIPVQFQLLQIPQNVLQALNNTNIQQEIQQILSSGTLTAAQQQALQALEAQLQNLQASGLTSLLNQPFITFGGGKTLFAATYPGQFSLNFNFNRSYINELEHATLRAAQGNTATLLIGTRYPVLTSSFGLPGQTTAANNNTLANFPTFNYEDLGITLKAKPLVHIYPPNLDSDWRALRGPDTPNEVTLDLDLAIRALAGASFNTIPVISNRQFKSMVRLRDGDSAVVVGSISRDQERSLSGIPGLGQIPVLGSALRENNKNNTEDELMVIVTPHIIRLPGPLISPSIPVPAGQ